MIECFYGRGILEPSTIEEYNRCEDSTMVIKHINHSLDNVNGHYIENLDVSNIWLKTYGLSSFMIKCPSLKVEVVINTYNLKKELS
jgi:hypothetical protein